MRIILPTNNNKPAPFFLIDFAVRDDGDDNDIGGDSFIDMLMLLLLMPLIVVMMFYVSTGSMVEGSARERTIYQLTH